MSKPPRKTGRAPKKETLNGGKSMLPQELPAPWVEGLLLAGLMVFTLLLFAESLSADFTFDDRDMVVNNPEIQKGTFWDLVDFEDEYYGWRRPLRRVTYMIDYSLFGTSPTGYHVHNLLWHLLSVGLFYILVRSLSKRVTIALPAALLFAIHPIHVEVVTNITDRKESLCMAFLLASFVSYHRFIQEGGRKRWAWLTGAAVTWILALSSKQVAIVLPLLLMTYEFLYVQKEKRFLIRNRLLVSGGVILGGALLLTYVFLVVDLENLRDSKIFRGYRGELSLYSVAITSGRTFWRYVELLVWPSSLCPDHAVELSRSLFDPTTLLSWVGLISLMIVAFLIAHRTPLLAFGIFWFLISYLPISNLVPTSYILADRYMYIPSAGFCIILVCLGEKLYRKLHSVIPRYAIPLMAAVGGLLIGSYSLSAHSYNSYWTHERVLWHYTLGCNPQSFRAYSHLGVQHYREGTYPKAIEDLTKAIKLGYTDDYVNRGSAFLEMKNYEAAIADYNQAIASRPDWAKAYFGRGLVYFEMGRYEQAIDDYTQAIELQADYSKAYNNRGLAYENLNRRKEALENYVEATRLDPDNGAAHNNLGRALVYAGRFKEAIQSYQRAEQLGVPQATKILEILNKQGLPNVQKYSAPSGPQAEDEDVENFESDISEKEREIPRSP